MMFTEAMATQQRIIKYRGQRSRAAVSRTRPHCRFPLPPFPRPAFGVCVNQAKNRSNRRCFSFSLFASPSVCDCYIHTHVWREGGNRIDSATSIKANVTFQNHHHHHHPPRHHLPKQQQIYINNYDRGHQRERARERKGKEKEREREEPNANSIEVN